MEAEKIREAILTGRTMLGLEFGSTRIKAVLVGEDHVPVASGSHDWENRYENHIWTYGQEDIVTGLQDCYRNLAEDVREKYGVELETVGGMGFSGMMHGYLAFDSQGNLLVPFRTWRNTITGQAAEELTALFGFNIPQRWSIAHLYQAILNGEPHVKDVDFITTLAGYIHWKLTGEKVVGVGEASGMFPIDSKTGDYDRTMMDKFDSVIAEKGYSWRLRGILPKVLTAGREAGKLTEEGARLLDPSGRLKAGISLCAPEGDAGTGMAATNSVAKRTGNVSAGTSIFAMIVLENALSGVYPEIDMVTTPDGSPVAMVHANNCTSDLNAWVSLLGEFARELGQEPDPGQLYGLLYRKALEGEADCGGMLSYGYLSGESITHMEEGRPLFVRRPDSRFTLANFMRMHLYSTLGAVRIGMDILARQEGVKLDQLYGHGGLFKTKGVGQKIMADALNVPVTVMETAGEGGPWGMALLVSYMLHAQEGESLADYLSGKVFAGEQGETLAPEQEGSTGFEKFMEDYRAGLAVEQAAVEALK